MATGYAIFALCCFIALPGIFRDRIPYEWFYGLHHLFVACVRRKVRGSGSRCFYAIMTA